jgi:hypothetical protein
LILAALLITILAAGAWSLCGDVPVPDAPAGFRSWKKLTSEAVLVPYALSIQCAMVKPSAENIKRYGPHTNRWVMVYANPLAADALKDDFVKQFPPGAMIAKEKLAQPGAAHPEGVAFMIKHRDGEFTASGGWEFQYSPSSPNASYESCTNCHRAGGKKDYVFGSYGSPKTTK